jgi:putative oxidoreductase
MKKQNGVAVTMCAALLILLFVYNSLDKLSGLDSFRDEINNQPVPKSWTNLIIFGVPTLEICIAGLLIFKKTDRIGFWAAAILLTSFTGYIGAILLHSFSYIPCSCAGVIRGMGWTTHLFFNLFFTAVAISGILLKRKEKI